MQGHIEQADNFTQKLLAYKARNPALKVWILTPCYASMMYAGYVNSLIKTMDLFRQLDIPLAVEFCRNDSLVCRARNNMVARAMTDESMTHIMFIDSDISWRPSDIVKLLVDDRDVVGGIYPLKKYYWERMIGDPASNPVRATLQRREGSVAKEIVSETEYLQNNLLRYNVNYLQDKMEIQDSVTRVKHIPTGFMMIRRGVFTRMMQAFPSTKYVDDVGFLHGKENDFAYALFDCGVEDGHYCSEDWMFCNRWSKMGGHVWIDVSVNLNHTGIEEFRGSFIATLV